MLSSSLPPLNGTETLTEDSYGQSPPSTAPGQLQNGGRTAEKKASLHRVHTLQEQLINAEAVAASRQMELDKLRQERREALRANRRAVDERPKYGETFAGTRQTELPAKLRAVLEDNRMLHERVKAYKKRLYEEHAMNLAHERHILRLHDDIKRLQELVQHADVGENKNVGELRHLLFNLSELPLQECDRSPQQVASDREIAETIEAQIKEISRLRGQVAVLTHAKESDAKRFRTIALERHREREELNAELAKLKRLVGERDKELRAHALSLKGLTRRLSAAQQARQEAEKLATELLQEHEEGSEGDGEGLPAVPEASAASLGVAGTVTASARPQPPAHARTNSAPHVGAASFMLRRAQSPLGRASLTGTTSSHRPLTGDHHAREEGGISLETLRAMRQNVRDRRQAAAAERVESVQTETVVVESAHVMVVVVRQEAVAGFNTRVQEEQAAARRAERLRPANAATTVQTAWRGLRARRELARLQQERAEAEAAIRAMQAQQEETPLSVLIKAEGPDCVRVPVMQQQEEEAAKRQAERAKRPAKRVAVPKHGTVRMQEPTEVRERPREGSAGEKKVRRSSVATYGFLARNQRSTSAATAAAAALAAEADEDEEADDLAGLKPEPAATDKVGANESKSPSRRTSHADEFGGVSPTRSLQAGVSRRMLLGSAASDAASPLGSTINRASLPAGTSRLAFTPEATLTGSGAAGSVRM
eukprot:jgi/Astpho2/7527/Aster-02092